MTARRCSLFQAQTREGRELFASLSGLPIGFTYTGTNQRELRLSLWRIRCNPREILLGTTLPPTTLVGHPCGNFSDTSCLKSLTITKGSIGPAFAVCNHTENLDQADICLFALREVSVPTESALGHLRYLFTDVPPQSNSQPDPVSR